MILHMPSKHANRALTTRPPEAIRVAAQEALDQRQRQMEAFIAACLTALAADPDRFLADLTAHWPPPRQIGRPRRPAEQRGPEPGQDPAVEGH
jgi:hypothetical protein